MHRGRYRPKDKARSLVFASASLARSGQIMAGDAKWRRDDKVASPRPPFLMTKTSRLFTENKLGPAGSHHSDHPGSAQNPKRWSSQDHCRHCNRQAQSSRLSCCPWNSGPSPSVAWFGFPHRSRYPSHRYRSRFRLGNSRPEQRHSWPFRLQVMRRR